jgi:hypothetical protein
LLCFCYQTLMALKTFAFKEVFFICLHQLLLLFHFDFEAWITNKCIMHNTLKEKKNLMLMHSTLKHSNNQDLKDYCCYWCVLWIPDSIINFSQTFFFIWGMVKANKSNNGRVAKKILTLVCLPLFFFFIPQKIKL